MEYVATNIVTFDNMYNPHIAWTTSGNSDAFATITDTLDNTAIGPHCLMWRYLTLTMIAEMHQYLDSDGSGTSETCVSSTIGAERIADATAWLQETGFKGFLGEIGAGSNDDWYVLFLHVASYAVCTDECSCSKHCCRVRHHVCYAASRRLLDWCRILGCGTMVGRREYFFVVWRRATEYVPTYL